MKVRWIHNPPFTLPAEQLLSGVLSLNNPGSVFHFMLKLIYIPYEITVLEGGGYVPQLSVLHMGQICCEIHIRFSSIRRTETVNNRGVCILQHTPDRTDIPGVSESRFSVSGERPMAKAQVLHQRRMTLRTSTTREQSLIILTLI